MADDRFEHDWLTLREDADHRARSRTLEDELIEWLRAGATDGTGAALRVVDLGCGTGSNLRHLAPRLPGPQAWTLVDHDADHLARVRAPELPGLTVRTREGDLSDVGLAAIEGSDLVTASALLDLASPGWIEDVARNCEDAGAAVLFTLSYDGTVGWTDPDPDDAAVRDAVNAHQRRDKGLGGALGPDAAHHAEGAFRTLGFRTRLAPSPWRLAPADEGLIHALVEGWCQAAVEERPDARARIESWARRRTQPATTASGVDPDVVLTVGHLDLLALPPR